MTTRERAQQASRPEPQGDNDAVNTNLNVYLTIIVLVSVIMSALGFHAILPNDGEWTHYVMVFVLSGAVFGCLKLLWGAQFGLFMHLAAGKLSTTAITSHILAVMLTFGASTATTFVGAVWPLASNHDFNVTDEESVETFEHGNRQFLSTKSVKTLIESQADRMTSYAEDATRGTLSGEEGKGPIFRTYDEARKSLNRLLLQLQKNEACNLLEILPS